MVSINETVFIQIINFLFLIWAMNKVLYQPVRNILIQRKEKISRLESDIENSDRSVVEKDLMLKQGIKQAREKGNQEKEALETAARQEELKLIDKINEKVRADLQTTRERILRESENARQTLLQQVDGFADEIVSRILGRAV